MQYGWLRFEYSSKEGSGGINRLFCCLRYLSAQFSLLSVEICLKRFESRCNMAGCLLGDLNIFIKRGTEAETFCCLSEIWVLNFRCQTLAGENCLKRFNQEHQCEYQEHQCENPEHQCESVDTCGVTWWTELTIGHPPRPLWGKNDHHCISYKKVNSVYTKDAVARAICGNLSAEGLSGHARNLCTLMNHVLCLSPFSYIYGGNMEHTLYGTSITCFMLLFCVAAQS